jgi:succinate dehydrogenase / fumarate reductase flavoprotein subunit
VFLDIATRRSAEEIKRKLPSMYHQFMKLANVDITKEPMEIGPTCHYMMGGVRVNPQTEMATVKGLFAAGEVAAGLHGANRLGGNSLSDLIVFGRRAGLSAAEYAKRTQTTGQVSRQDVDGAIAANLAPLTHKGGENPYAVHKDLQDMMQEHVGIMRDEEGLKKALGYLDEFEKRVKNLSVGGGRAYNPGWHMAMDLRSMLITSRSIAMCALARKESRGGHARSDFPDYDPHFSNVNHVTRKINQAMQLEEVPRAVLPEHLKELVEEA